MKCMKPNPLMKNSKKSEMGHKYVFQFNACSFNGFKNFFYSLTTYLLVSLYKHSDPDLKHLQGYSNVACGSLLLLVIPNLQQH